MTSKDRQDLWALRDNAQLIASDVSSILRKGELFCDPARIAEARKLAKAAHLAMLRAFTDCAIFGRLE